LNASVEMLSMLDNCGMDCINYSATLNGWAANPLTPSGRLLFASGRQYGTNAAAARTTLTNTKGWGFAGDSPSGTVCVPCTTPAFTACPGSPVTVNTTVGLCSAAVGYTVTADGIPAPTLTYDLTGATIGSGPGTGSGSMFNKGSTTVTVTAANPCGAPTCVFTVTVTDLENPSIVCPTNIVRNTDANQCSAVVAYANPTFSDNCPGAFLTLTSPANTASGSAFPAGTSTMVNWKVTDAAGNMSFCQFTVTVNDTHLPSITCPTNIVRSTDAGQCYATVTYATPTATDNCAVASVLRTSATNTASGSQFLKGATSVTWEASDNATPTPNKKSCSFTVTVNDAQAPSITCPSNIVKDTDANQCHAAVTYATPTYADNCSGGSAVIQSPANAGSGSNFPKGQNIVTWRATDAAGLTKTCTFRVTVNDTQAPSIICPSSQSVNTVANGCASAPVIYTTPTATDNCPGSLTVVRLSGPISGSSFPSGTTSVIWRAIDGAGRSSTCSFAVTVTDNQAPIITCPDNQNVTAPAGQCSTPVFYSNPTATDNCGMNAVFLLSGLPSGSNFPQGTTTNVWRAVDVNGGSQTCSFTVTVGCGASPSGMMNSLSPNPAVTEVQISIENMSKTGGELRVHDAQGRLMWQQSNVQHPTSTVSLEGFAAGLYFVTLRSEGKTATKRLVVSRL